MSKGTRNQNDDLPPKAFSTVKRWVGLTMALIAMLGLPYSVLDSRCLARDQAQREVTSLKDEVNSVKLEEIKKDQNRMEGKLDRIESKLDRTTALLMHAQANKGQ